MERLCQYLGVFVDDRLHLSEHINRTRSKANKLLHLSRRLGQFKIDMVRLFIGLSVKALYVSVLFVGERKLVRLNETIRF